MGLTVYAENMGFFHKGSGGKGVAPADVCLSPPPAPTGPVPVPYVNNLMASNLAKGSKKVKIDGKPTALEDASNISTSTGDEPGNQGGNVITHKTKGKGYFKLWSFTVFAEGKGVDRHGDMMGQNCSSDPPGCVDAAAVTSFTTEFPDKGPCPEPYNRSKSTDKKRKTKSGKEVTTKTPNGDQKRQVLNQRTGAPKQCWTPGCSNTGSIADHQPPLGLAWYLGGCHDPDGFRDWAHDKRSIKGPHCPGCSEAQMRSVNGLCRAPGGTTAAIASKVKGFVGL